MANYIRFAAIAFEIAFLSIPVIWMVQFGNGLPLLYDVIFLPYIIILALSFETRVNFANHGCGFVTLMVFLILRGLWALYGVIIIFSFSEEFGYSEDAGLVYALYILNPLSVISQLVFWFKFKGLSVLNRRDRLSQNAPLLPQ